jgi:hypothetical protein
MLILVRSMRILLSSKYLSVAPRAPGSALSERRVTLLGLAGQTFGIKEISDRIWLVFCMHYDRSFFDHEACRLEPVDNPFEPKVHVPGMDPAGN